MVEDLAVGLVRAAPWLTSATLAATTFIKVRYQSRTARQGIHAARAILDTPHRRGGMQIGFGQFKGAAFAVTVTETSRSGQADPEQADPEPGAEFTVFYAHAYPWATSRLRGITGVDADTAHDAVQDAFIACLRHWPTLKPMAPQARGAYLLTAATRKVGDRRGRESAARRWDPAADVGRRGGSLADHEHVIILRQVIVPILKNLPERQREIVLWRHYADLTVEQIASHMGISPRTVRTHLARAHRCLDRELTAAGLNTVLGTERTGPHDPRRRTL